MHPKQKYYISSCQMLKVPKFCRVHWVFIDTHIWNKFFHHDYMRLHCFFQVNVKYFSIVTHGNNRVNINVNYHVRTPVTSVPPKTNLTQVVKKSMCMYSYPQIFDWLVCLYEINFQHWTNILVCCYLINTKIIKIMK